MGVQATLFMCDFVVTLWPMYVWPMYVVLCSLTSVAWAPWCCSC